ncbi:glycosyltransferase family 8 protein [Brachyspira aalborgi]|uniref:glycosyltransferase family 8 protein n=1 Tax=Brachyspira aalborgi TaxID=29522 RepID=UPI0026669001|nr:glycosyltransferase family 8 protein [Brachyspira aalborgi]
MNIFFAVNNDYTKYLSVAMASILYNLDKEQIINFFILDGGISDENKKKLNALKYIKNFNIEYIKVDKSKFENILEYHFKHITIDANYRLIMSSVKPDLDKCLYLYFDLVVDKDITELYSINIDSFYIGAVVDAVNQNNYINSGVMLVNLERWRKEDIEYKLFHNLIKYSSRLICPDQDIINITLRDRIKYLNPKYNAMPVQIYVRENEKKEAFYNPVIIH